VTTLETQKAAPKLWRRVGELALLLCGVQALRAAVEAGLWAVVRPGGDQRLWPAIGAATFVITGALLLAWRRPPLRVLGLDWGGMSPRGRAASTLAFAPEEWLNNLYSVLIVPVFEELLFRGYGWQRIRATLTGRYGDLWTWALTTGLFGLWHLGYTDHMLRILPYQHNAGSLAFISMWKVIIGLAVGFLAGLARWRTGKSCGSIYVHGLWNLFGR